VTVSVYINEVESLISLYADTFLILAGSEHSLREAQIFVKTIKTILQEFYFSSLYESNKQKILWLVENIL
jgi:hypothetical protein